MERQRILIVDDDPLIRGSLYELLRGQHYGVEMAADGLEAVEHLKRQPIQLLIADWKMPQMDGMSLLEHVKHHHPDTAVILITGFGTIHGAVDAIRQGAFDYLTKPIRPGELEEILRLALQRQPASGAEVGEDPFEGLLGQDPKFQQLLSMVNAVAQTSSTVLLEGESGTGKRLVAQAIHRADPARRDKPFVEVSCGALPETLLESELFGHVKGAFTGAIRDRQGRFELADSGTILLDEIDAFSPALQVKLLRVIQERCYEHVGDPRTMRLDLRIIAATNRSLSDLVKEGKFREDLYYRLNVIRLSLPPLRERKADLPLLARHFLARNATAMGKTLHGISDEAMAALHRYAWPGNIRELENVMERAVLFSTRPMLEVDDLPEELLVRGEGDPSVRMAPATVGPSAEGPISLKDVLRMPERDIIVNVLEEVRWNRSEAAKRLGIHRSTLYHKLRQLGIFSASSPSSSESAR